MDKIYIPGDRVDVAFKERPLCSRVRTALGPGLSLTEDANVLATNAGYLRSAKPKATVNAGESYFITSCGGTRYQPVDGDYVLGVVMNKGTEIFRLDINAAEYASLRALSFEGATKRMKPDVQNGDLILCQLIVPNSDMEPEATCVNDEGQACGLGVLNRTSGVCVPVPATTCVELRLPDSELRRSIMKELKCELCVGLNGRVAIDSEYHRTTIAIAHILQNAHKIGDNKSLYDLIQNEKQWAESR